MIGMNAALLNAHLQAPRERGPVDGVPAAIKNPYGQALDGQALGRRLGSQIAGMAHLSVPSQGGSLCSGCGPLDLSPIAQQFRSLGVDPADYSINASRNETRFKLSMQSDNLQVGTQGAFSYSANSLDLDVHLTQTEGDAQMNGAQVHFKRVELKIDFKLSQAQASSGDAPDRPGSAKGTPGALDAKKDDFLQSVVDQVQQLAQKSLEDGGIEGSGDAVQTFGQDLGNRLYSLMQGVAQIGASTASAAYDPMKAMRAARLQMKPASDAQPLPMPAGWSGRPSTSPPPTALDRTA